MKLSDLDCGCFKIKSEVVYLLMHKLAMTEKEVMGELCSLVVSKLSQDRAITKTNARGWNVQRNTVTVGGIKLYVSVSVNPRLSVISVNVSIPNFSHQRCMSLSTVKQEFNSYLTSKLEAALIGGKNE